MIDTQPEVADISALEKRVKDLQDWLKENAPEVFAQQKHLDEGSQERVYWHYGYFAAVRDIYRLLTGQHIATTVQNSSQRDTEHLNPLA